MPNLCDPMFGPLVLKRFWWQGKDRSGLLARGAELRVARSNLKKAEPPTDHQRRAYTSFLRKSNQLATEIEKAIIKHYNRVKTSYRAGMTPDAIEMQMPELQETSDVWHLLSNGGVSIPEQTGPAIVLMQWNAAWDFEGGLEVTIKNGKIAQVDRAGGSGYY